MLKWLPANRGHLHMAAGPSEWSLGGWSPWFSSEECYYYYGEEATNVNSSINYLLWQFQKCFKKIIFIYSNSFWLCTSILFYTFIVKKF